MKSKHSDNMKNYMKNHDLFISVAMAAVSVVGATGLVLLISMLF